MENIKIEVIAEECFENFTIRSFFQDFEKDMVVDKKIRCKMHDIVHDFAQSITKNECFEIHGDKKIVIDCKSACHLHLKISKEMQCLEPVCRAKILRTLFLLSHEEDYDFNMLLFNSFQHFRFLRILILDCPIKKLLDTVENLIHLRCLFLSKDVCIEELLETVCNLCKLQTLSIKNVHNFKNILDFKKLPQGMSKLINLRHLNLRHLRFSISKDYLGI